MKKKRIFLPAVGVFTACMALAGCGSTQTVTLEEMQQATQTDQLLKTYTSVQTTTVFGEDNFTFTQYADKDLLFVSAVDQSDLYLDGVQYFVADEDIFSKTMFILQEPLTYYAADNLVFEADPEETIKSCEKKDGKLYVSTELTAKRSEELVTNEGYTYNDGEYLTSIYILDAKTKEIQSFSEVLNAADGTTCPYVEVTAEYGTERPAMAQELYEHSTTKENLRTVTIITDPDTDTEQSNTVQLPKGDRVLAYFPDGYDTLFTDRDCTEEATDIDYNADETVLYMAKGK